MGKRPKGLTGISRLALQVFEKSSSDPNESNDQPSGDGTSASPNPAVIEKNKAAPVTNADSKQPRKRRKINPHGSQSSHTTRLEERYDATGLVPHYRKAHEVPSHLQKYFSQRKRYFSLYDEGCLLDEEGWYSVTPERVADQIAERCRCDTVLDAFCGVGGNAIAFAKTCERVIAMDTSPTRLALARHNAAIYGVADRIEFILADYISFAHSFLSLPSHRRARKIDVVFLSPPWGGPSYLSGFDTPDDTENLESESTPSAAVHPEYSLASVQPIHGAELFKLSRQITPNIAFYLPRNSNINEISSLIKEDDPESSNTNGTSQEGEKKKSEQEMVEIEEQWMGEKLKSLTCYFGGLVAGQEDLF